MALKIIGAIGNVLYNVVDVKYRGESIVRYEQDGKEVIGSPYSLITILHYINRYEPELVKDGVEFAVCVTNESDEMHLNEENEHAIKVEGDVIRYSRYLNFKAEIEYYNKHQLFDFPITIKKIETQHNYDDSDKWDFFDVIYEYVKDIEANDYVVIDLTTGNRTFPTMVMLTTNFYESILSQDIVKGVYYVNANAQSLVNLSDMYLITKWSSAINSLLYAGSNRHYHDLINDLKNKYSDHELSTMIEKISYQLEDVVDALKLMKIGFYMKFDPRLNYEYFVSYKIVKLIDQIRNFKEHYQENSSSQEIVLILRTLESIEEQFNWIDLQFDTNDPEAIRTYLNQNYYIHVYHLLKYYQSHEMYQQAITIIKEVLFPFNLHKEPPTLNPVFQQNSKSKSRKQVQLAADYYTKYQHIAHLYVQNEEDSKEQQKEFFKKLTSLHEWRNKTNHAFQVYIDYPKGEVDEMEFNRFKNIIKNDDRTNKELIDFLNENDDYIKTFAYKMNEFHNNIVSELQL